jgi:hypothetical protein
MNCSDCHELYKERKQKPPCDSCPIGKELDAEQEIANVEYLNAEEQGQAEAEEIARQEAEAESQQEEYEGGEWGN